MELIYYMLLSTLEGVGVFYLTLTIFRFKIKEHWLPLVLINLLIAFISYTVRGESDLSWITPVIQLFLLVFFIQILLRIPLIWSVIMSITGIVGFTLIQVILIYGLASIHLADLDAVKLGNTFDTYIVQAMEILIVFPMSFYLYRKGLGFTFDFGTFKFRWENVLILILLLVTFLGFAIISLMENLLLITFSSLLCLILLLTYHFRRERES